MRLAKYFKSLGNNERTIVFAAFTAEEVGGYGSQYFSKQNNGYFQLLPTPMVVYSAF
jgi:Zn-dependent M28 family amino/carboxypeptidase